MQLHWLPVQGYTDFSDGLLPWLRHLVLPAIALSAAYVALVSRITRSSMIEIMHADFIRTARAKGVANLPVLFVHALKNASVSILTVIGIGVAGLMGGAVITESLFSIPGIGQLVVDSILRRDYPMIQGIVLLFSFTYVLVNLLVDLSYTALDPRIRF